MLHVLNCALISLGNVCYCVCVLFVKDVLLLSQIFTNSAIVAVLRCVSIAWCTLTQLYSFIFDLTLSTQKWSVVPGAYFGILRVRF